MARPERRRRAWSPLRGRHALSEGERRATHRGNDEQGQCGAIAMLNAIIDFSLRHRLLVILAVLPARRRRWRVAALSGHRRLSRHDAGAGADQHRRAGARPGGSRAADHLPHRAGDQRPAADCRLVRSISKFGLSQVVVTFEDGTDIYFARQLINERLATVALPVGHRPAEMGPVSTGLGEVFHYVVTGKGDDADRTAHHPRLDHPARDAHRARAWPRSIAGAATRSSTRCASIRTG